MTTNNEVNNGVTNETATQDKRTSNAEAIAHTYYEYHGEYSDALDNDFDQGFSIVDAEGACAV